MHSSHGQFFGNHARSSLSSTFLFTESLHTAPVVVPRHTHPDAHFALLLRGDYVTSARTLGPVGGAVRLIFNPAGTTHRDRFQSATGRCFSVCVLPEQQFAVYPTDNALREPVAFGSSRLSAVALRMFEEFRGGDALSEMVLEGLGLELFARAARELDSSRRGRPPAWFATALDLIRDRCCEPLTIREIAREVGVHPYHLARVSRRFVGKTPGEVLRDCRIEKAARLLSQTTTPIGTVAVTCGYADQSQFTRSFRRAVGMSPGAYRSALSRA
jgi:AraC family transcriptional regulator